MSWDWAAGLALGAYALAGVLGAIVLVYVVFIALRGLADLACRVDDAFARAEGLP